MRLRDTLQILGGSILVYTAVATCGAAGGGGTATRDGGRVDVSTPGGLDAAAVGPDVSAPGGFDVSRVLDVLTNPVPDARADPSQSGTRLKAKYYVGADGSKQLYYQWYDSQRGEDCSFETASDGTLRCLPGGAIVSTYFADTGCTEPLSYTTAGPGCAAPKTAYKQVATSCPVGVSYTIYQLGSLFTGTPYSGTPSSCNKATAPSGYALYSLGAEIPASSFVSATVQTDQ